MLQPIRLYFFNAIGIHVQNVYFRFLVNQFKHKDHAPIITDYGFVNINVHNVGVFIKSTLYTNVFEFKHVPTLYLRINMIFISINCHSFHHVIIDI